MSMRRQQGATSTTAALSTRPQQQPPQDRQREHPHQQLHALPHPKTTGQQALERPSQQPRLHPDKPEQGESSRPPKASVKALPKTKPPPPPKPSSGSESETSWPSEDPPDQADADEELSQQPMDATSLMQKRPELPGRVPPSTTSTREVHASELDKDAGEDQTWAPPQPPRTAAETTQVLAKVLHELLQKSFAQPSEAVTTLAYRACYYVHQMQKFAANEARVCRARRHPGGEAVEDADPFAFELAMMTPLLEAIAALEHLVQKHGELPRRVAYKELAYIQDTLESAKDTLRTWEREPEAPGVHEGVAGLRNSLDYPQWNHLAIEEGGVYQTGETLRMALQALRRSVGYVQKVCRLGQARSDRGNSPAANKTSSHR